MPPLLRDKTGRVDVDSVPDVIEWFLGFDERVAVIRHPKVEEVFQWKQTQSEREGEEIFNFKLAEDRFAIGVIQALAEHPSESALHAWICQLLSALDNASKANEAAAKRFGLDLQDAESTVREAERIPRDSDKRDFLINCWIEVLCTAEARVLGWLYQQFYNQPFTPKRVP